MKLDSLESNKLLNYRKQAYKSAHILQKMLGLPYTEANKCQCPVRLYVSDYNIYCEKNK